MNRYVCQDIYNDIRYQHFKSWKTNIKEIEESLDQITYNVTNNKWLIDSSNWGTSIFFHRSPQIYHAQLNFWGNDTMKDIQHVIRQLSISNDFLYSIGKLNISEMPPVLVPSNYYYSNGSLPRRNGTIGFN